MLLRQNNFKVALHEYIEKIIIKIYAPVVCLFCKFFFNSLRYNFTWSLQTVKLCNYKYIYIYIYIYIYHFCVCESFVVADEIACATVKLSSVFFFSASANLLLPSDRSCCTAAIYLTCKLPFSNFEISKFFSLFFLFFLSLSFDSLFFFSLYILVFLFSIMCMSILDIAKHITSNWNIQTCS